MEHVGPLIQTLLWVGLIGGIMWRFHKPIDGILSALHKRIDGGSNVKAGWFELTDQLRPQDPLVQQERAAQEIKDVLQSEEPGLPSGPIDVPGKSASAASIREKYFQAEDLALRAIQAEYGAAVQRQVTAGADLGFDGAFVTNGRLNIVEVKYVRTLRSLLSVRNTLERLVTAVTRYHWKNVQIVLAVVFDNPMDVLDGTTRLHQMAAGLSVPVVIRSYGLTDLRRRFGVSAESVNGGLAAG